MSGFSSFKESKLLFENWRRHVNEALSPEEQEAVDAVKDLDSEGEAKVTSALSGKEEDPMSLTEDGHTDVASAVRKMKVACENAEELLQALAQMPQEGDLPSWWMSKATLAANYLSKMRDFLLHSPDVRQQVMEGEKTKVSKAGQKRVSAKIGHLVGKEKMKPDQAAAIAYSMEKEGKLD